MRQHRLVILVALLLLYLNNSTWAPPTGEHPPPASAERPELPHHAIMGAWQSKVVNDIRRDYLVNKMGIDEDLALEIVLLVDREATYYDVNANRILALIVVESYGNPEAVSHKGAIGLMQILPSTGRFIAHNLGESWNGPRSLKDVEVNISFGTWYYQHLRREFRGDIHATLAAYNWGPGAIIERRKNGQALPQIYPGKVRAVRQELDKVLWDEYRTRFWRGLDSFVHRTRECYNSGRSARECGVNWPFVPDGESLLSGNREGVLTTGSRVR